MSPSESEEPEQPEFYRDRRDRNYLADQARRAGLLKDGKGGEGTETEAEYAAVLDRDDEVLDAAERGTPPCTRWWSGSGGRRSRATPRARWSRSRWSDADPVGTAIDAYLEPHYDTDTFEVLTKKHRVEHEDEEEDGEGP